MKMHSTSRQRKEQSSVDKENAEQLSKMPTVDVVARKVTSPNTKSRINSDDRWPRIRGLRASATNVLNNVPRRRVQSSCDAGTTKAFVKTRFTVYDDGKPKSIAQSTERHGFSKTKDIEKWLQSVHNTKHVPSSLPPVEKPKDDKKLSSQTFDIKESPKNLPMITKPAVCNIKEKHNNKSLQRKTPRAAYELLSLELAYNIDYMTEYIRFQMEMNEKKKLSSSFLKRGITADQRRLIVKYLIDSTTYYRCPSFILYQAVKIFDSYIDKVNVHLHELQTIALAALWIAQKKDLIIDDIPEAATIMKLAASTFKGDQTPLLESEKKILMLLQFEVNFADPFSMLALFAIMIEEVRELQSSSIEQLYYCGSYLMDLSMLDNDLCDVLALHLAEVCTEIALVVIMTSSDNIKNARWNHWLARIRQSNPVLEKYVLPNNEVIYIRNRLLQMAVLSRDKGRDYYSVYKKYCTKRYDLIVQ
ncbi:uncharacterized protein LOC131668047 isoform X2 [Phymastichus coffea]|uniref:uncharacterized protein LOC131668047 isoform X2 n=1 Tax=Phymastichus coffea TaxID=108790 RepID=UPI00273B3743|nr:uncharacterized protein LOC131668047 isoform X2 [Phymastichus coffea]